MSLMRKTRGAALAIVVFIAAVCAIAAYFALFSATTEARHGRFYRERLVARAAAEAGLVIAMQRLYANPGYCGTGGGTETFAIPVGAGSVPVTVTISDCNPANRKQVSARVDY